MQRDHPMAEHGPTMGREATGVLVFSGAVWARAVGILLAVVSVIANFLFIPYYPFWSLLMIALDIFVIWALAGHRRAVAA